jgi:uncharacterized protein with FMN-binding domain
MVRGPRHPPRTRSGLPDRHAGGRAGGGRAPSGRNSAEAGDLRDASVEVTISGGEVTSIRLLKGGLDGDGNPAEIGDGKTILDLYDDVLAQESLQVDGISGATLTSKAHLKALENALSQAQN